MEEVQCKASFYTAGGAIHIPSLRWLLSRLHLYFGRLPIVQCKCRRYGSILYLYVCDLVKALSAALGKSQPTQKAESKPALPQPISIVETVTSTTSINDRIHIQA